MHNRSSKRSRDINSLAKFIADVAMTKDQNVCYDYH